MYCNMKRMNSHLRKWGSRHNHQFTHITATDVCVKSVCFCWVGVPCSVCQSHSMCFGNRNMSTEFCIFYFSSLGKSCTFMKENNGFPKSKRMTLTSKMRIKGAAGHVNIHFVFLILMADCTSPLSNKVQKEVQALPHLCFLPLFG